MSTGGHDRGADAATRLQDRPTASGDARDEAAIDAALGGAGSRDRGDGTTTKEQLGEVGARGVEAKHYVPAAILASSRRSFVRWLLGSTLVACAVMLGVLWWLDPISVTGRQTRFSVVENGGVRQAKLDLMEELKSPPGVLVLGSSRTMKLNPAEIERVSGETAFNGGVSGGTSQDMYLYARYADELWGERQQRFPHLVIGVVHDVLRSTGTAALDPRLKRFMPKSQQERDSLEVAKQLLQLTTVKAAVRSVRRVVAADGAGTLLRPEEGAGRIDAKLATTGRQKGNQRENLDERGMQLFDPGANYDNSLAKRVETQMTPFVQRSYVADSSYTGVDDRGLEMLRRTIALANSHGDVPTLWVTPFQPGAKQYLPESYEARDAKFRAAIRELQRDPNLKFTFTDLDDIATFGGDPNEFHDGIHMTEKNTAKVIRYLNERGALAGSVQG